MSLRQATVVEILETREKLQKLRVSIDGASEDVSTKSAFEGICVEATSEDVSGMCAPQDASAARTADDTSAETSSKDSSSVLAYNYLELGPRVTQGERVLVNTVGTDLGLGTGNTVFVVPGTAYSDANEYGHIVKLRYTPLQIAVDSAEEQDSPFHTELSAAKSIEGMPVVCCELHSQMPLVAAAIKYAAPTARVAYVMNDVAALPLAFSELVYQSKQAGLIDHTITSGQAFGGDYEAINVYSALLVARIVCLADITIVAPGPGIAGSGTLFGHNGIAQGEALNAVAALQGTPIAALRLSWSDLRARHAGLSHHSETVLGQVCHTLVTVPVPGDLFIDMMGSLEHRLAVLGLDERHEFPLIECDFKAIDLRGVNVTTMGRAQSEDPEFFSAAFAAGVFAARTITQRP